TLHNPAMLIDELDVEGRDRLGRLRLTVAKLGDAVVDEYCVADEYGTDELPVADTQESDRGFAKLARASPHQSMRICEAKHSVRNAAPELAALGVDIARV